MARIRAAVSDTGPVIHLEQVYGLKAMSVVRGLLVPEEVVRELHGNPTLPSNSVVTAMSGKAKDLAKLIADRYGLGPGESATIAIARQEGVRLVLTDDLEARDIAKEFRLEPHGSLALVARAFREGQLSRKEALGCLEWLHTQSSLYLTSDLVEWAKGEISSKRR